MIYKNHTDFFEAMKGSKVSIISHISKGEQHIEIDELYEHFSCRMLAEMKKTFIEVLADVVDDMKDG